MQIYWTKKSIPELSQLPSGERSRLWRQCYKEAMHERQSKIGLIIVGLLAGIGAMLLGPIGAGIGGGIGGFIFGQIISNKNRPYLRAALENRSK
jgi:hypothetical protein